MSEKFNGFSQAEINKVSGVKNKKPQTTDATLKQAFRSTHSGIRRMPEKWSKSTEGLRKQQVHKQITAAASENGSAKTAKTSTTPTATTTTATTVTTPVADDTMDEINLDRSMSKSLEEALFYQPMKQAARKSSEEVQQTNGIATTASLADDSSILPAMDNNVSSTTINSADESILLTTNYDAPFKGISLKDFETHRNMIQEQNKQKKDLLLKAIEHHSQKTAAEARKIADIKRELAKLDNDLACDVAILRKQIDNACVHFSNVEKQYMKIEAQFLKAKIDLHKASEKKELLTEHLCTVITHNEDRKAKKLTELMEKVGLTPTGEYDAIAEDNVDE